MSLAMSASIHCTPWNSADRLAELLALLGIVERGLEPGLADADGERGDADAALVEHAHHHVEAAPSSPSSASAGSATSLKFEGADLARALAHLVLLRPRSTPSNVQIDDEDAHAAMAGGRVGAGKHETDIGDRRVVDPDLAAVQHASRRRRAPRSCVCPRRRCRPPAR